MHHTKIFYLLTGFMLATLAPIEAHEKKVSVWIDHSNEPYKSENGKNGSPGYYEDGEDGEHGQNGGHGGNGGNSVYGNGGNGGNGGDVD